jgi:hypothetical protein
MIETGIREEIQLDLVERKPGSDEADIKAGGAGVADELHDIGACERLTTCEIGLKYAGFSRFFENARPHLSGEFAGAGLQFKRIRAVDAVERAAMRKFSDES